MDPQEQNHFFPEEAEEAALDDFLGGPRAETWRSLRETLTTRLKAAIADRDALQAENAKSPRLPALNRKIDDMREQVAALRQEEAITQFVEESVRATLSRPRFIAQSVYDEDE